MHTKQTVSVRSMETVFALSAILAVIVLTQSVQAQTFTVIHNFTGGLDGNGPTARMVINRGGYFYGTTALGGAFELRQINSGWVLTPLASFGDGWAGVTIGPNGSLYGTTEYGGTGQCQGGCGTVYNLTPQATACKTSLCYWNETVIHQLAGPPDDGSYPLSDVTFDQAGNLFGTTQSGGSDNDGIVFELTPSHGIWAESVLYTFTGGSDDGASPFSGMIFDTAGNLYGTTLYGGPQNAGTIFELSPTGSGWQKSTVYNFANGTDGSFPAGGLVLDQFGNIFGTTAFGGANNGGTVFKLTPSNGGWTFSTIFSFGGNYGSYDSLFVDSTDNLYGTTAGDGTYGKGSVFELTPSSGGWTCSDLHDFTGGSDGSTPWGGLVRDASGNVYGTASGGGAYGYGVVFEITGVSRPGSQC